MIVMDGGSLKPEGSLPGERYVVMLYDYSVHYITHRDFHDPMGHIDFHDRILWHGPEEDWLELNRNLGINPPHS